MVNAKNLLINLFLVIFLILGIVYLSIGEAIKIYSGNKKELVLNYDNNKNVYYIIEYEDTIRLYNANRSLNRIKMNMDNLVIADSAKLRFTKYSFGKDKENNDRIHGDLNTKTVTFFLNRDGIYSFIVFNKVKGINNRFFIEKRFYY